MANPLFPSDLGGTLLNYLKVGYRAAASRLKYVTGGFVIRNAGDSADAALTASKLSASGDDIEWNSDAAGTGDDWKQTLSRPATGMTADLQLFLPPVDGSPGDYLGTDGAGQLAFIPLPGGSTNVPGVDNTALAFGSTSTLAMFTKPANGRLPLILVNVKTAFNGTNPTVSIGVTGTLSKYAGTDDIDLTTVGIYAIYPDEDVTVGTEAIIATYAADSSSAGAAIIETTYVVPN